jgi:hypothetical protein
VPEVMRHSTLEDDTTMLPQNLRYQLPSDVVSHPRRMDTLVILLQKPKILRGKEFNKMHGIFYELLTKNSAPWIWLKYHTANLNFISIPKTFYTVYKIC